MGAALQKAPLPAPLTVRQRLELAVQRAIDALDALRDCDEDVGCEDEGWDSDTEPEVGHLCSWRSGEVNQLHLGGLMTAGHSYRDAGREG